MTSWMSCVLRSGNWMNPCCFGIAWVFPNRCCGVPYGVLQNVVSRIVALGYINLAPLQSEDVDVWCRFHLDECSITRFVFCTAPSISDLIPIVAPGACGLVVLEVAQNGAIAGLRAPPEITTILQSRLPWMHLEIVDDLSSVPFNRHILIETLRLLMKLGCVHLAPKHVTLQGECDLDQFVLDESSSTRFVFCTAPILSDMTIEEHEAFGIVTVDFEESGAVVRFRASSEASHIVQERLHWMSQGVLEYFGSSDARQTSFNDVMLKETLYVFNTLGYKKTDSSPTRYTLSGAMPSSRSAEVELRGKVEATQQSMTGVLRELHALKDSMVAKSAWSEMLASAKKDVEAAVAEADFKLRGEVDSIHQSMAGVLQELHTLKDSMSAMSTHAEMGSCMKEEIGNAVAEAKRELRSELGQPFTESPSQGRPEPSHSRVEDQPVDSAHVMPCATTTNGSGRSRVTAMIDMSQPASRLIRLACHDLHAEEFAFEALPNGIRVCALVGEQLESEEIYRKVFDDTEGHFELREDECSYEDGILLVVLKRAPPRRMMLKATFGARLEPLEEHAAVNAFSACPSQLEHFVLSQSPSDCSQSVATSDWFKPDTPSAAWPDGELGHDGHAGGSSGANQVAGGGLSEESSSHAGGSGSARSVLSWASAAASSQAPHCFLPDTPFRCDETGRFVRAAELSRAGGELLCGPNGAKARVLRRVPHRAQLRNFVSIRTADAHGAFVITEDHRLLVRGENSEVVPCTALDLAEAVVKGHCPQAVYDGRIFHEVVSAQRFSREAPVIEVWFEGDAAALAWVLPRRRRSASAESTPLAVLGQRLTAAELRLTAGNLGLRAVRTFLDPIEPAGPIARPHRPRSVGAQPLPGGCWSIGTEPQQAMT
mmetsp:Transcript_79429/g.256753  ORF Transcript_79429/g.256753 Transcript_79429/m.256753 type:complete len:883 (+) Transcript_79429:548-3196(+)